MICKGYQIKRLLKNEQPSYLHLNSVKNGRDSANNWLQNKLADRTMMSSIPGEITYSEIFRLSLFSTGRTILKQLPRLRTELTLNSP